MEESAGWSRPCVTILKLITAAVTLRRPQHNSKETQGNPRQPKEIQGNPRKSKEIQGIPRKSRAEGTTAHPALGPHQPSSPSRESPQATSSAKAHIDLPKTAVGMGPIYLLFIYFPLGWWTFPNENTSIKADLVMLMASDSPSPRCGCSRINLSSPIPKQRNGDL